MQTPSLKLAGFTFAELFHTEGLNRLDQAFLTQLQQENPSRHQDLLAYREESKAFAPLEISELLLDCAPVLENFLINLFGIQIAAEASELKTLEQNPVSA